jgi:hypothetical protein
MRATLHVTLAAAAALASIALASAVLASDPLEGGTGTLRVTLRDAVPFVTENEPAVFASPRNTFRDLHVDMSYRNGALVTQAWAYAECLPGLDHAATVRDASVQSRELRLRLTVRLLDGASGGGETAAAFDLSLRREGARIRGQFTGEIAGAAPRDPRAAKPMPRIESGKVAGDLQGTADRRTVWAAPGASPRHPRLFFSAEELRAAKGDAVRRRLPEVLEALRQSLDVGQTNGLLPRADSAVGWGVLGAWNEDPRHAIAALRCVEDALATPLRKDAFALARQVAGIAVAYDLCYEEWPADARAFVASYLGQQARQIATLRRAGGLPSDFGLEPWAVQGPYDPKLAALRAAGGLGALAIRGDPGITPTGDVDFFATVAARSVRRFLETAVGWGGASSGHARQADGMNLALPFARAWRHCRGEDLAADSGVGRMALWEPRTGGGADGGAAGRIAMYWQWADTPCGIVGVEAREISEACVGLPLHVAALLPPPAARLAGKVERPPLALEDQQMGAYAFRSCWDDPNGLLLCVRQGRGPLPAANLAGHLTLSGLGREWLAHTGPVDRSGWPARASLNVVQMLPAARVAQGAAFPAAGAELLAVRAEEGQGGCVAMVQTLFSQSDTHAAPSGAMSRRVASADIGHIRRTVAVDFTGRCGAPALLVTVDEAFGYGVRQPVWQADLGRVSPERVRVKGNAFAVKPGDGGASLRGVFVHPGYAHVAFIPREESSGTTGGWIRVWFRTPERSDRELFDESLADGLDQAERLDNRSVKSADKIRKHDPALGMLLADFEAGDPEGEKREWQRRQKESAILLEKVVSSGAALGETDDRAERGRSTCIGILTIQTGTPPEVRVTERGDTALFTVGERRVVYRGNLVRFE